MSNLFSGVTYPIVGIVIALILFDGLKEGILLPIFNGMYQPSKLHRATTEISYESSGALVVTRGPFVFRIGYLVSRVLLALLLLRVLLWVVLFRLLVLWLEPWWVLELVFTCILLHKKKP